MKFQQQRLVNRSILIGVAVLGLFIFVFITFGASDVFSVFGIHWGSASSDSSDMSPHLSSEQRRQRLALDNARRRAGQEHEMLERIKEHHDEQQLHHHAQKNSDTEHDTSRGVAFVDKDQIRTYLNCTMAYEAFVQRQSSPVAHYSLDELRTKRQRVRNKWQHTRLIPGLVFQIQQYKMRVANKIMRGANAQLWKPIHAVTRVYVERKKENPKTIPTVMNLFAREAFTRDCFAALPECSMWARPDVMLATDDGQGIVESVKKNYDPARSGREDVPLDSLQYVDIFFGVKCCVEHAELKNALKGAYALLSSSTQQMHGDDENHNNNKAEDEHQHQQHHRHVDNNEPRHVDADGQPEENDDGAAPAAVDASVSVTAGSLIAAVREEGYFIPYDTDVDLLIQPKDEKAVAKILFRHEKHPKHLGVSTQLLEPPLEHAHGRLLGFVYGTPRIRHEEASRVEIWVAQETRKMQKRAVVLPHQKCWLQEVEVECPARPDLVLKAGYGDKWCVPCKSRSSNCKKV